LSFRRIKRLIHNLFHIANPCFMQKYWRPLAGSKSYLQSKDSCTGVKLIGNATKRIVKLRPFCSKTLKIYLWWFFIFQFFMIFPYGINPGFVETGRKFWCGSGSFHTTNPKFLEGKKVNTRPDILFFWFCVTKTVVNTPRKSTKIIQICPIFDNYPCWTSCLQQEPHRVTAPAPPKWCGSATLLTTMKIQAEGGQTCGPKLTDSPVYHMFFSVNQWDQKRCWFFFLSDILKGYLLSYP
jgi:hypothetical protein